MNNIGIKQATAYNMISKFSTMFIQLGLNMILARLIAPEAFGIVSITTVIVNFFNMFADMGIGISIIQDRALGKNEFNRLFTFSLYIGLVLAGIMIIISYPVSIIYKNPIYKILCPCISIMALTNSLNAVPNAILSRNKRFDLIAIRTVICNLASGVITVVFALIGWGVYALILHSILTAIFVLLWNYIQNPLKFVGNINLKGLLRILGSYSLFQLLFNIMNYLTRNLDNLFIGASFGEKSLGYYNKAYTLNLYPNMLFTNVVSSVLHPYMRDFGENIKQLYTKLMKIVKFLSLVAILVQMVFFWCSDEIIEIMFGPNWAESAVCFHFLSYCIWAQMLSSVCGAVFLALKRTDQTFKCGVINIVLIFIAIGIGMYFDSLKALSLAIALVYNIIFAITYVMLIKFTMKTSMNLFYKTLGLDFFALVLFMLIAPVNVEMNSNIWVSLFIKLGIIAIYYIVYLIVTNQFSLLWGLVSKELKKRNKKVN